MWELEKDLSLEEIKPCEVTRRVEHIQGRDLVVQYGDGVVFKGTIINVQFDDYHVTFRYTSPYMREYISEAVKFEGTKFYADKQKNVFLLKNSRATIRIQMQRNIEIIF